MTDVAELAPPPPSRPAPSAPTHSTSASIEDELTTSAPTSQQLVKPPHLRIESNGNVSASPPQSASSPHTLSSFSPRSSPLGRRSNLRLHSPRTSVLSPSHSLPSLQTMNQPPDEATRQQLLGRSSSNNRLSAIISRKAGISPIVTSSTPPSTAPVDSQPDGAASMGGVELKQEANGTDAASSIVAVSSTSSPFSRPSPLERPNSITLSLPMTRAAAPPESGSANGTSQQHSVVAEEEEAPSLTISHSEGAAAAVNQFLQQPLQPLSSASSVSTSSPQPPADPITPITPFSPNSSQPAPSSPVATSANAAYKDQLDGVLRKRGDSHLNLHALDPSVGQLSVPLPLQMRQMSAIGSERRVAFRVDRADGLDLVDLIPAEDEAAAETRLTKQWHPGMRAQRGILKTVNIKGTEEERRRRSARAVEREREWVRFVQEGGVLIKYNAQSKPQKRWVYVSEDGHEIIWEKANEQWLRKKKKWPDSDEEESEHRSDSKGKSKPTHLTKPLASHSAGDIHVSGHSSGSGSGSGKQPSSPQPRPFHQHSAPAIHGNDGAASTEQPSTPNPSASSRAKRRSSLPSMRILNWKINADRTRFLADALGVHFGPYHSAERFNRFLQRKDYQVIHATAALPTTPVVGFVAWC